MHYKDYFRVHFVIPPLPTVSHVRLGASGDWLAYVWEGTNINLHNIYNGDTVPLGPLSNIRISHAMGHRINWYDGTTVRLNKIARTLHMAVKGGPCCLRLICCRASRKTLWSFLTASSRWQTRGLILYGTHPTITPSLPVYLFWIFLFYKFQIQI